MAESQRRLVTVLFADISGFTSMSEKMDSEAVTALVDECFAILGSVVARQGGAIDKYMGDCVMATFGVPEALEDAAVRAVETALEMRWLLHRWRDERGLGEAFDIHIGINSGEAISGSVGYEGKRDFTVMGDSVNLASRLKDAAPKGRIYVGPLTWRYTSDVFEYRQLSPVAVKGKARPIEVYEAVASRGTGPAPDGVRTGRAVRSGFVGRREELAILERQVLKAVGGEGSAVFLSGEAGVGKSRLVSAVRAGDCMDGLTVLEGSAQSRGTNLSYHVFIRLLDVWAGITAGEGDDEIYRKLETAVMAAAPDSGLDIFPFLALMHGVPPAGHHRQRAEGIEGEMLAKSIGKSLRDLLSVLASRTPVVVVLEDLQWADASSLGLLGAILRLVRTDRICLLLSMRSGLEPSAALLAEAASEYGSRVVEVPVRPLGREDSEQMLASLLGSTEIPRRVLDLTVTRTSGNPFFLEEVVRSWLDEGMIVPSKSGFDVTPAIEKCVVPYTVNQVIMARIDRLDGEAKSILRAASVIGRSFSLRVLGRVVGAEEPIDSAVGRLAAMQIVERSRASGEDGYAFRHALIQQSIYDSLLLQTRRRMHAQVARAIESVHGERLQDQLGILAFHFIQAEETDTAMDYLARAGDSMLAVSASPEALYYFGEALKLYGLKSAGSAADRHAFAVLHRKIALARYFRGDYPAAVRCFDEALAQLGLRSGRGVGMALSVVAAVAGVARFIWFPGRRRLRVPDARMREVIEILPRRALSLYSADPRKFVVSSLTSTALLSRFDLTGIYAPAYLTSFLIVELAFGGFVRIGRRLLARPEMLRTDYSEVERNLCLYAHIEVGLFEGSWSTWHFDEFADRRSHKGELMVIVDSIALCGLADLEKAEFRRFEERVSQLNEIAEEYGNAHARGCSFELRAKYFVKIGRAQQALELEEQTSAFLQQFDVGVFMVYLLGLKARALLLLDRLVEAEEALQRAEKLMRKNPILPPHFEIRYAMSRFALETHELEAAVGEGISRAAGASRAALKAGRQALRLSRKWMGDRTEALRLMGSCRWLMGRREAALRLWRESMSVGETVGARLELARTWAEVGTRLQESGSGVADFDGLNGAGYLAKAEAFFKELELLWDLDRLPAVRSSSR